MNNPLYQQLGGSIPSGMANMQSAMRRFEEFRRTFQGDPRQQIQNLLNTGRVTQSQYNTAVQMAQQFQRMMGWK